VARRGRVAICMPAYHAAKTLVATLAEIPDGCADDLILGDDASTDGTAELAERLDLQVIRSPRNRGYGGNQKQIYQAALERGADIIVMLHPDGQYDAALIPSFVGLVESGVADLLLGNRIRTRRECLNGGMPVWKYVSNRLLTIFENVALGQNLGEFHSGFRVYRRGLLEAIPFHDNSEGFAFDSEVIAQAVYRGFKVADAPMPVRYFPEASSISFSGSVRYGLRTVWTVVKYWLQRTGLFRFRLFAAPLRATPRLRHLDHDLAEVRAGLEVPQRRGEVVEAEARVDHRLDPVLLEE
jgi:glycosyltransferase involved in cell wall biosynthesis